MKERSRHNLNPLEKQQAEQKLNQEMLNQQKKISQKEYKSKLQTMDYTEKNKKVLSTFLQIKN
jgi:ribosomal protein S18